MIPYFFMEVECIGNTQIIHMEETGIFQRTIGLIFPMAIQNGKADNFRINLLKTQKCLYSNLDTAT